MLDLLLAILESWAKLMPLPVFTFLGGFIEEIIAPIPSPFVMTLAGSFAAAEDMHVTYLVLLAIFGAVGKTIGAFIIYWLADTFENIITSRFGKMIGVSHSQITKLGDRLDSDKSEWWVIFGLRAMPVMPTAPVSFGAGLLELKKRTYLSSTLAGLVVRNIFYLYLGYTSAGALDSLNSSLSSIETIGYVFILGLVLAVFIYIYRHRRKHH